MEGNEDVLPKKKKEKISILLPPGEIAEKYEQKRRRRCFKSLL